MGSGARVGGELAVRDRDPRRRQPPAAGARAPRDAGAGAAGDGDARSGGAIDRTRLLTQLDAALAEMEPRRRDVFILFEIAEQSMHDVARAAGCPLKTAYKRLYAARREVAARFGVVWGTAPDASARGR